VLTSGLSGSGKSTLAALLVEALGAIRVRSDVERKRLFGLPTDAPSPVEQRARLYAADATRRTYQRLSVLATRLLDGGISVVVDAALLRRDERDALRALAQRLGIRFDLIECHAPEAVLRQRLRQRAGAGSDASDADEAVLQRQLGFQEPIGDDEGACRIDTDCAPVDLERRAMACLRADPLPPGPGEHRSAA
jgi:predicted kinase